MSRLPISFGKQTAEQLVKKFSSPLYVYSEKVLRENCKNINLLGSLADFKISYAIKANSNIALLKIIRDAGLQVEAMTLTEIHLAQLAGFTKTEILFSSNNICEADLSWLIKNNFYVCLDSLCQLERYFNLKAKKPCCIRINPTLGSGHHQRVITAGKVKFGIDLAQVKLAFELAKRQKKTINGFVIHIGSLFLNPNAFHKAVLELLALATQYPSIEYIDFGGGFGIPYRETEKAFPMKKYAEKLQTTLNSWRKKNNRKVTFAIQPGRYIAGSMGCCLTTIQSIKQNQKINFVGTDLGFNFLLRPEFYNAYHRIVHTKKDLKKKSKFTIVGNVCESGDILGRDRYLPATTSIGDVLAVSDTGAYGFAMASNYNSMMRPAEVMINLKGEAVLIRKRETVANLVTNQIF